MSFYVDNSEVDLQDPILGNPFLSINQVTIKYPVQGCVIIATLFDNKHVLTDAALKVYQKSLNFVNLTSIDQNKQQKYIFQTANIFFGQ